MAKVATYKHETEVFDAETGEIKYISRHIVSKSDDEENYIKVYKYLNTVFAFKGINPNLISPLMEISNYMTYADKGQTVILIKSNKQEMAKTLGMSLARFNSIVQELKKADILRPTKDRSVYSINPFIVARGKWSDVQNLRALFDYNSGLMQSESIVHDKITGETIAKITSEARKSMRGNQITGQLSLNVDGIDDEND